MKHKTIFQISDIFSIEGMGEVVVGILKEGTVRNGMKTSINGKQAEVLSIESDNQTLDSFSTKNGKAGLLLNSVSRNDITAGEIYFD